MPHLVLQTEPACLDQVHGLLAELWAREPGVPGDERDRFTLALAEVVGNVVEHGRTEAGAVPEVVVHVAATPEEVIGEVVDDGVEVPDPDRAELPDDPLAEGGRGLALAHMAVDEVAYERGEGRNRWRLVLRRA